MKFNNFFEIFERLVKFLREIFYSNDGENSIQDYLCLYHIINKNNTL